MLYHIILQIVEKYPDKFKTLKFFQSNFYEKNHSNQHHYGTIQLFINQADQ